MIAGVVLAAGGSRRLGQPKQLVTDASGTTLVERAARRLLDAGCAPVLVVVGAEAARVSAAVEGLPVVCVANAAWADGMGTSIAAAVRMLEQTSAPPAAVLIAACDMPDVSVEHLQALLASSAGGVHRVASRYVQTERASRGIPAVLPRADWPALAQLAADVGARDLLKLADTLSVDLRQGNLDLDTLAEVRQWQLAERCATSPLPQQPMTTLAQTALADIDHEFANTRRMLERVPEAHLDFTPHEKSWTLRKLAHHLTDFGMFGAVTVQTPGLDFAAPQPPRPPAPTTAAEFVAQFDAGLADFRAALAATSDEALLQTWTMSSGEQVIMAMPRIAVLRGMVVNHMIHHRAQLTIYYRLLNVSVPGLYGPSADEAM